MAGQAGFSARAPIEVGQVAVGARGGQSPATRRREVEPNLEDHDTSRGERLRWQNLQAFERSLRRRKRIAFALFGAALLIGAGGGIRAFRRTHQTASAVEQEPNNTVAEATLLPLDTPVLGKVGKHLSQGQPDVDYFRVPPGTADDTVSARLEGSPEVDLVLELLDSQGAVLAKSDSHGVGGSEWLQPTAVGPGGAYLVVRQVWVQGTPAIEDVPDPYRLGVHWGPAVPGWEVEPNDEPARATMVEPGQAIQGYLASAEDRDWFVVTPTIEAAGTHLVGRIKPPADVDIVVTIDEVSESGRRASRRTIESKELDIPVTPGRRILLGLARRSPAGGEPVTAWRLVGLDAPYELRLESRPAP